VPIKAAVFVMTLPYSDGLFCCAFLAEGLLLQTTILAAKMFVFLFQDGDPLQGVQAFPIADLLQMFKILPAQRANFATKLRYFRTQFANALHPVADVEFRSAFFKQKAISVDAAKRQASKGQSSVF
jgi:hypothetical protein